LFTENNSNNGLDSSLDNACNSDCYSNSLYITPALIGVNQGCVDTEVLSPINVKQGFSANNCNYVNNKLVINDNVCFDNSIIERELCHVNNSEICLLNEVVDERYLSFGDDFSSHLDTNLIDSIVPPPLLSDIQYADVCKYKGYGGNVDYLDQVLDQYYNHSGESVLNFDFNVNDILCQLKFKYVNSIVNN
jgi:hypothetical protein